MENNYFNELSEIACETDKKKDLTYISWADAWAEVKKQYPDSTYTIYENTEWHAFFETHFWIDCKVGVTINWIEHIVRLPVMDWANKAMKVEAYEYVTKYWPKTCQWATQFEINKTIQRAFTKAIAMHWVGLYVYRGEDLPSIDIDSIDEFIEEKINTEDDAEKLSLLYKSVEKWLSKTDREKLVEACKKQKEKLTTKK